MRERESERKIPCAPSLCHCMYLSHQASKRTRPRGHLHLNFVGGPPHSLSLTVKCILPTYLPTFCIRSPTSSQLSTQYVQYVFFLMSYISGPQFGPAGCTVQQSTCFFLDPHPFPFLSQGTNKKRTWTHKSLLCFFREAVTCICTPITGNCAEFPALRGVDRAIVYLSTYRNLLYYYNMFNIYGWCWQAV